MAYNSTTKKISGAVSVYDVQRAIGSSSGDVHTLCESASINQWAKYRPIAVGQADALNVVRPLTLAERKQLSYGFKVFWDTASSAYGDLAYAAALALNNGAKIEQLSVKPFAWSGANNQWHRLSDFDSNPADDANRTLGYYHLAKPFYPRWHWDESGAVTRYINPPLIQEESRTNFEVVIGMDKQLTLPNDYEYLQFLKGSKTVGSSTIYPVVENDDPWSVSAVECLTNAGKWLSDNLGDDLTDNAKRGVIVLVKVADSDAEQGWKWAFFGLARANTAVSGGGYTGELDLTDTAITPSSPKTVGTYQSITNIYVSPDGDTYPFTTSSSAGVRQATWNDLKGSCVFLEFYHGNQAHDLPIVGYGYYVTINRVTSPSGGVDYLGHAMLWQYLNAQTTECTLRVCMPESTEAGVLSALQQYYTSLQLVLSPNIDGSDPVISHNLRSGGWLSGGLSISGTTTIGGTAYNNVEIIFSGGGVNDDYTGYYWVLLASKSGGGSGALSTVIES